MIAMAARIASRVSRRSLAAMSACRLARASALAADAGQADVRAHLVFERGILARAIEGLLVFVVVVVHGSAPFLIVGLFAFLIVGLLDCLLDCLHVRLPACNQV